VDARDRVLDAALDLHAAMVEVRQHAQAFRGAAPCSIRPGVRIAGPRGCFEDEAWSKGESIDHYCAGCREAAERARARHQARRRVLQVRTRLVRAAGALGRTFWATRRAS